MTTDRFRPTRWSLVERIRDADPQARRAALEALFQIYWPALYVYARGLGLAPALAADLVQGYAAELLERGDLEHLRRDGGRLRHWLRAGLRHHHAHERERAGTQKRGGSALHIDIDAAEQRLAERADAATDPERAYDRAWGEALLARAYERLRAETASPQQAALLPHLVATPGATERVALGTRTGLAAGALRVALHRLRRRYAELVRAEVAETTEDADAVIAELLELRARLPGLPEPGAGTHRESARGL
jgi:RNA polymerase sigma-70 factor (ECF subfamily)